MLLLLLLSNKSIGVTMRECVPLLKRVPRGSIENEEGQRERGKSVREKEK